jgi:hypothetical protein
MFLLDVKYWSEINLLLLLVGFAFSKIKIV